MTIIIIELKKHESFKDHTGTLMFLYPYKLSRMVSKMDQYVLALALQDSSW